MKVERPDTSPPFVITLTEREAYMLQRIVGNVDVKTEVGRFSDNLFNLLVSQGIDIDKYPEISDLEPRGELRFY